MSPRIEVSPGAAVALAVLVCIDPAALCAPFLLAAAMHEGGHLAALRLCRVPVRRLHIGLGGAVLETGLRGAREEVLCAAAGPAVNLLLAAVLWRAQPVFALINLLLGAWNLLPVFPLDGGRIAGVLFSKGAQWLERLTFAFAVLAAAAATAVFHMGLWPVLLALCLLGRLACTTKAEGML